MPGWNWKPNKECGKIMKNPCYPQGKDPQMVAKLQIYVGLQEGNRVTTKKVGIFTTDCRESLRIENATGENPPIGFQVDVT
jgi:hypothetical protein